MNIFKRTSRCHGRCPRLSWWHHHSTEPPKSQGLLKKKFNLFSLFFHIKIW